MTLRLFPLPSLSWVDEGLGLEFWVRRWDRFEANIVIEGKQHPEPFASRDTARTLMQNRSLSASQNSLLKKNTQKDGLLLVICTDQTFAQDAAFYY